MLIVKQYQDRTSKKITCQLTVIHNNKVKDLGVFSLAGAISYIDRTNHNNIEIIQVKNVKSLKTELHHDKDDVIRKLKLT
jgi:tetrahydromethanopterin S-methyltransferase subunit A